MEEAAAPQAPSALSRVESMPREEFIARFCDTPDEQLAFARLEAVVAGTISARRFLVETVFLNHPATEEELPELERNLEAWLNTPG